MLTRKQSFLNHLPCNFKDLGVFQKIKKIIKSFLKKNFLQSSPLPSLYNFPPPNHEEESDTIHLWYNYLPWQHFLNGEIVKLQITQKELKWKRLKKEISFFFRDKSRALLGQVSYCLPYILNQTNWGCYFLLYFLNLYVDQQISILWVLQLNSIYLSIYLPFCLSLCPSVCMHVCMYTYIPMVTRQK